MCEHQLFEPDPDCAGGGNGNLTNQVEITGNRIAACVRKFRERRPHVHCITNSVAQHFTANVLLAAGATPSMTIAEQEISDFVTYADALLINLGTMDTDRSKATRIAVSTAIDQGKPWVLDPVFAQASPLRMKFATALLGNSPSLVRCNQQEAKALFSTGIDHSNISMVAQNYGTTIAITGRTDVIGNEFGTANINNGSPVMDRVTAMGCALTALIAGFLTVDDDHLLATASAIGLFGLAGERAETISKGPGSFTPHFLDALSNLSFEELESGVKV